MEDIMTVILHEDFSLLIALIESNEENMNYLNENNLTVLHAAVNQNRYDMVQYLIDKDRIPIDSQCVKGRTCLFMGCELEEVDINIIQCLLDARADVNLACFDLVTPLHAACRNGNYAVAKLLIEHRANVNARDRSGYTALHTVALSNSVPILELLLLVGVHIDMVDEDICTALMVAVDVANFDVAVELIKHNANVNVIGRNTTALHLAVVTQDPDLFKLLWARTDFETITALAEQNNLLKLMIKYGWFFPDRIDVLFHVLDHPNIKRLCKNQKILQTFFYRIHFVKNIREINCCTILRKFLQVGIRGKSSELRSFIQNFHRSELRYELLQMLIQIGEANFDDLELITFAIHLSPDLMPTLLSTCIRITPLDIFRHFCETTRFNKQMLKLLILVLYLCTPTQAQKKLCRLNLMTFTFQENILDCDLMEVIAIYDRAIQILKEYRMPTLKELSRDEVRRSLAEICTNSNEYLNVLNSLLLAEDIKDLIQCKMAVHLL